MFIAFINLLSFGAFFIIVTSIVFRQLFLQEIWKYIDLNGDVTRWQIITIVSRVKLNRVLYFFFSWELPRAILVDFMHGHSAKAQTSLRIWQSRWSLCPIVNAALCTGNCFRSEWPSTRLGCEYERFRNTGWSTKESWDVSGVYLSIYLVFILYLFYFIFFVMVSLECKAVEDSGSIRHLFGQFIFHQEPMLDQTMTNLSA